MAIELHSKTEQSKKTLVLAKLEEVKQWPYWNEVYLNAVKESPMSYDAFVFAVQGGDCSHEAFDQALLNSRMTQEEFSRYLPEYQKFMALLPFYENVGMLSDGVDQIWHAHMLVSYRYTEFCMRYFGSVMHHMPCSVYELYNVTMEDATDSCLAKCNPTTCQGEGGGSDGCKKKDYGAQSPEEIQQGILHSAPTFVEAYLEVFGASPSLTIWNQLQNTTKKFVTA